MFTTDSTLLRWDGDTLKEAVDGTGEAASLVAVGSVPLTWSRFVRRLERCKDVKLLSQNRRLAVVVGVGHVEDEEGPSIDSL